MNSKLMKMRRVAFSEVKRSIQHFYAALEIEMIFVG